MLGADPICALLGLTPNSTTAPIPGYCYCPLCVIQMDAQW